MSTISQFLAPSRITLDVPASTWQAAIRLAGDLLETEDVATADYTDAMIDTVKTKGPYIVIAPGFAFAHAQFSTAVKTTGMSVVRLREPVKFGHETNDPVRIVLALAATDHSAHLAAMGQMARVIGDVERRKALETAATPEEFLAILDTPTASATAKPQTTAQATAQATGGREVTPTSASTSVSDAVPSTGKILTVCGNGLGTSLFLKNSLDELLVRWGWAKYMSVEATDTISAKGKAKEADAILTSGAIAQALGDVGVPVRVIQDFTSLSEIDAALRSLYVVE
ncbi:MAG: PTS sugar transporter subunit IIA [Corynebacterium sp.]|uniref:PTS sugar transporter subunit IIA n=1 Tax=Corynebacterium sp. TaxID=1720 RepID=UPI0026DD0CB1|nr:PTS sugar transporter subunit IIA [Corynebacterium sp.]MDO5099008.1 PTS sugar transporter subunit IIA [Corynebacterium sp.]